MVVLPRENQLGGQAVQPLIAAGPLVDALFGEASSHECVSSSPAESKSEWEWLRTHKAIRSVLGVSYERFKLATPDLLWDIKARHQA